MNFAKSAALLGLMTILVSSCDEVRKREGRKEALNELSASQHEMTEKIEMTDEGLNVDFDAIEAHRKKVESAGAKMGGKMGEALKIASGMQVELNRLGRECDAATDGFVEAIDWQSLSEKRDYEDRRKVLRDYISLNRKIMEAFGSYYRKVMIRLDEIGFKGQERKDFDRGFSKKQKETTELVRIIRQCDIDCSELAIRIIDRLEALGDGWKWNPESESLEFYANEDADWFNAEIAKFEELGTKQIEAQTQFARLLKAK